MTINGPAPMLLGYFLNAAIDQQCEIYIKKNGLDDEVKKKIAALHSSLSSGEGRGEAPAYQGSLPKGNDGLGLMLLGATGDQALPKDVYEKIKEDTLSQVRAT